jgi:transposase
VVIASGKPEPPEPPVNVRYIVELSQEERADLEALTRGVRLGARKLKRAQILLATDRGATEDEIAAAVATSRSTIWRTKQRYVEGGIDLALNEQSRRGAERKLDAKQEATLVAIACTDPPKGRSRWTLHLLANQLVVLTDLESVSRETVRRRLAEKDLKPWQSKMWCIPEVDAEYVARMEDVLELYAEPHDPKRPVVCFDGTPVQLIGETRVPIPAAPGRPQRMDYEYRRNGTANLFVLLHPKGGWRHVAVTEHRTKLDFTEQMRALVDEHFPQADTIRVVLDCRGGARHPFGRLVERRDQPSGRAALSAPNGAGVAAARD